jgi:hypothetical protein
MTQSSRTFRFRWDVAAHVSLPRTDLSKSPPALAEPTKNRRSRDRPKSRSFRRPPRPRRRGADVDIRPPCVNASRPRFTGSFPQGRHERPRAKKSRTAQRPPSLWPDGAEETLIIPRFALFQVRRSRALSWKLWAAIAARTRCICEAMPPPSRPPRSCA